jgi:hypothetical protein
MNVDLKSRWLYLVAAFLLTFSTSCSAAVDEDSFAADMLARVQAVTPGAELSLKPDEPLVIEIHAPDERDGGVINLHRIWNFCKNVSEADCEIVKTEFVGKIGTKPPTVTRESLRLIVRDQDYHDYLLSLPPKDGARLAIGRPIGERIFVFLASDAPETIQMVGDAALEELGLSEKEAWDLAFRQTKEILPALPTAKQLRETAVGYEDEGYLASLLIDLDAWGEIAREVGPDLFVTAVSDQFVFVAIMPPGKDLEGFRHTVAEDCAAQQRCILPDIYRFRERQWVVAD